MDDSALVKVVDRGRKADSHTEEKHQVQWITEQFIERHTAWILQFEYRAVRVASDRDRSGGPCRIQHFSKRAFVLQPFQTFRRGMLRDRRKHKDLRPIALTPPPLKTKLFPPSQPPAPLPSSPNH